MNKFRINIHLAILGVRSLFSFGRTYWKISDKIDTLQAQKVDQRGE